MYERYWQLERNPFDDDADLSGFFRSETHQATLLKLRYLIENAKGAGLLAGATGIGKSFLIQVLSRQLPEPFGPFVHLVFPQMSAAELLSFLAFELGAAEERSGHEPAGLDRTVRDIEQQLRKFNEQGRHPVIVVDEAHLIEDPQVFQALRLLLNFQHPGGSRFSLIFAGHNELFNTIRRLGQLEERLAVKCLLRPLSADETTGYVSCRLEAAGASRPIFEPAAMQPLFELSGGVPRRINRLCDLALLVGFADESSSITAEQVEAVSQELTAVVPD
ncbi:MAG: AAA family ATPase [Planctomycetia bacterium]|nr:AAA family ATPase [Planctomycetia bacterium]